MSQEEDNITTTTIDDPNTEFEPPPPQPPPTTNAKIEESIESLFSILPSTPPSLAAADNPAFSLLHNSDVAAQISSLLREPNSGAGDNNLCRWLYDTFQSSDPSLQLIVLRFLPIIVGVYLSGVAHRKPLAGFEAVLLALYAHETTARNGQAVTVNIPDLSHSSIYHETKTNSKNNATELNLAVISPSLEPHGTVRSTRRARIVGVALELYYNKIFEMPVGSKIDFCHFCVQWAGQDGDMYKDDDDNKNNNNKIGGDNGKEKGGRIGLPWELLQPVLRILGHCCNLKKMMMVMGPTPSKNKEEEEEELHEAAYEACRCLYARAVHDISPKAILATGSLLRLLKIGLDMDSQNGALDHTEISMSNVITL